MSRLSREKKKEQKEREIFLFDEIATLLFCSVKIFHKKNRGEGNMKGTRKKMKIDQTDDRFFSASYSLEKYITFHKAFFFFFVVTKNLFLPSWYNVVCIHSHQYSRSIYNYPSISILLKDKGKESFARPSSIVVSTFISRQLLHTFWFPIFITNIDHKR